MSNANLYIYVEYKLVHLCGIKVCTFMWNTSLNLYVEYKLVHLCGIQTCTFMYIYRYIIMLVVNLFFVI